MPETDIPLSERLLRDSHAERDPLMRALFRISAGVQLVSELDRGVE